MFETKIRLELEKGETLQRNMLEIFVQTNKCWLICHLIIISDLKIKRIALIRKIWYFKGRLEGRDVLYLYDDWKAFSCRMNFTEMKFMRKNKNQNIFCLRNIPALVNSMIAKRGHSKRIKRKLSFLSRAEWIQLQISSEDVKE